MEALKNLVTPFVGSGVADGVKLVVLGTAVETARRVSSSAWTHFVDSFFLTAHFSEEDYPYDWLMHWLSKQPAWQRTREFDTTTRTATVGVTGSDSQAQDDDLDEENVVDQGDPDDELTPGKQKMKVIFQPTYETQLTILYKSHWLRVKRSKKPNTDIDVLSISVVARSNKILKQLVLQAKKEYEQDAVHRVQIYFADSHGSWRWTDSRHKRPMSSIVLNPGVKEMLLADARDFLRSEKWYADRGIPFRRGYLLYGVPGSGKTSLIHALAGELALDIYVISLSASWMSDATLSSLMSRVPSRCLLLLEDLDAAFTRSLTRDALSTGAPVATAKPEPKQASNNNNNSNENSGNGNSNGNNNPEVNTLSLSGLLNSIDGVSAAEGRLLFATTNHLERLDPALSRPGRMDVWVEFRNASKLQAEGLFRNFFPCTTDDAGLDGDFSDSGIGSSAPPSPTLPPVVPGYVLTNTADGNDAHTTVDGASPFPPPLGSGPTLRSSSVLDAARLAELAKAFADAIPEDEFPVAALQGYLLKNKVRPEAAAYEAAAWVDSERKLKERLKKEQEARLLKEQEEKERRRRELLEKELEERVKREEALEKVRQEKKAEKTRTQTSNTMDESSKQQSGDGDAVVVESPAAGEGTQI